MKILTCLLAALVVISAAAAQTPDNKPPVTSKPNYLAWIKFLADTCPKQAVDAVIRPGLAPIFKVRPADIGAMCDCAVKRFQEDVRLREYLDVEPDVLAQRLTLAVQTYGGHRFNYALMACLAPEMDRSISAMPLNQ